MTKKQHARKKSTPKAQPDVDVFNPSSPATASESSEKVTQYSENEGFFAGSEGFNFPDYRNGNLATPVPSRSSSLASEASMNSLADLLGPELDDEPDSDQDQDHDSQEEYKSTDLRSSSFESKEIQDDLWWWVCSDQKKAQRVPGLQGRDWAAIGVLTFTAMAVRLWEIDTPNQVVPDEAHVGKYINAYLTKQFTFDTHPPLGKMLLAGISKLGANYSGTFPFDDINDTYPDDLPYKTMRSVLASMGALCAPMAYLTLRALGQAPVAAILAAFMIIFDNALIASHRLMTLEAPVLFFTALSLMSWSKFTEQKSKPFTGLWWTWLVTTGVAVAGATATKTDGLLTMLAIVVLAGCDLRRQWRRGADQRWPAHIASRILALVILPGTVYLALFSLHLTLQTHQPPYRTSAQGDYDLTLLSHPFRHSLLSPYVGDQNPTQAWSDVVYGSVIQLQSETRPAVFLHSFKQMWNHSAVASVHDTQLDQHQRQYQQVAGYEHSDLNTLWTVVRANITSPSASVSASASKIWPNTEHTTTTTSNTKQHENLRVEENEIPKRLQYLKDGDLIRLRHVSTRRCLHSRNISSMSDRRGRSRSLSDQEECSQSCEVSAVGEAGSRSDGQKSNNYDNDDGPQDWWTVQVIKSKSLSRLLSVAKGRTGSRIKALETTFRLRHHVLGCYLQATERDLSEEVLGGAGRRELSCVRDKNMQPSTIWRITMNEHDYLPMDTALAAYPKMSTFQKIAELHTLMWTRPRAFEASEFLERTDPQPNLWFLMMGATSTRTLWRKTHDDEAVSATKEGLEAVRDKGDGSKLMQNGSTIQQNSIVANPVITPAVRRRRAPVLQKHYPSVEEALPMQHVFMTPSQRPPQLWHVNRQAGEPNPYQRQQMQAIFELIEKEEKQRRVNEKLEREKKERLERLERQRLELEEKRREMERELKREQEAKERERLRFEVKRKWEVELEVEEELRRELEEKEGSR
ncbi:hypothetical protein BGZ68_002973 [Mortierella alpina]|nr:hypothetical protein BGZ68_002973 [Mortierella alpina]